MAEEGGEEEQSPELEETIKNELKDEEVELLAET